MAGEKLTINRGGARLEVIGKSWADTNFDSGEGWNLNVNPDGIDSYDYDFNADLDFDIDTGLPTIDLPERIEIERLPYDKNLTVKDGEKISITGIRVKAYMADGSVYVDEDVKETLTDGTIRVQRLQWEPRIANIEGTRHQRVYPNLNVASVTGYTRYARLFGEPCYFNESVQLGTGSDSPGGWGSKNAVYMGCYYPYEQTIDMTTYGGKVYYVAYPERLTSAKACCPGGGIYGYIGTIETEWRQFGDVSVYSGMLPESSENPIGSKYKETQRQTVTVSWPRPVDGKLLTASYEITVEPNE